nr:oocyte zinc finger protein XlCOF19-like [Vanessa tameamea]
MVDNSLLVPVASVEHYSDESISEPLITRKKKKINLVYCALCHVNFYDASEYEQHNAEIHGLKKYPCVYCESSFRRQDHLKRHINSLHSTGTKSLKCPICEEDFQRRDSLFKHVKRKHSDEKCFQCRECSYQCESIEELESHDSAHLLQETHICSYCKKPFKRRDHMLRHIKTLHLNQYTVCPVCSQQFKRKDHVVRHCREKHRIEFQNGKIVKLQDNKSD